MARFWILISFHFVFGCGYLVEEFSKQGKPSSSAPSESAPILKSDLSFEMTSYESPIVSGCYRLTYNIKNQNNLPYTIGANIDFEKENAEIFSDSSCETPLVSTSLAVGSSTFDLFYRPTLATWKVVPKVSGALLNGSSPSAVPQALNANLVLGQVDLKSNASAAWGVQSAVSAGTDGSKLFLVDTNRILVFNSLTISNSSVPDLVLGQKSLRERAFGEVTASSLSDPNDIVACGSKYVVVDPTYNRALIFGSLTKNNQEAEVVLGQNDFFSSSPNQGATATASTLNGPRKAFCSSSKLIIADTGNNRILIWNSIPTSNGVAADVVIGQVDFVSSSVNGGGAVSSTVLNQPRGLTIAGGNLYVADTSNHRVLIYSGIPTSNGAAATGVLGQPNLTSNTQNNGGISATTLYTPRSISASGSKFIIVDTHNSRIKIFNTIPTSNVAPDYLLGQTATNTRVQNDGGLSQASLSYPESGFILGNTIFVGDGQNYRFLGWSNPISANKAPADHLWGQPSYTENFSQAIGASLDATHIASPRGVTAIGSKFAVADFGRGRVLLYNSIPTSSAVAADVVVGQANANTVSTTVDSATLSSPNSVASNGTKLVVNCLNRRVLIWNSIPTTSGVAADVVIGQPNFTSNTVNNGGVSASSINWAYHVHVTAGGKLLVTDYSNHRVLVFNSIPTTNFAAADLVIGQPDFFSNTSNNGGLSSSTLRNPISTFTYGTKLFVVDGGNNRVLIWNTFPTVNGQGADLVLGQPDFISSTANNGGLSSYSLRSPTSAAFDGTKFFIADKFNSRVIGWNGIPSTWNTPANYLIGQPDFLSRTVQHGGMHAGSLGLPHQILVHSGYLWIADDHSRRVVRFPLP